MDDQGQAIREGDAIWLEPHKGVSITVVVTRGDSGLTGCVTEARVDAIPGVVLDGQAIESVSADKLLRTLQSHGVSVWLMDNDERWLTTGAVLVLTGDRVDNVQFGSISHGDVAWKDVSDPRQVEKITRSAAKSD